MIIMIILLWCCETYHAYSLAADMFNLYGYFNKKYLKCRPRYMVANYFVTMVQVDLNAISQRV